jgi:hypothetical protein
MSTISRTGSNFDSSTVRGIQINTERSQGTDGRAQNILPFGSEPAYTVEISAAGMAAYLKSVREKKARLMEKEAAAKEQGEKAAKEPDLGQLSVTEILGLVAKGVITSDRAAEELEGRQKR